MVKKQTQIRRVTKKTKPLKVVLGITGSIAAYKAVEIARELMSCGFDVQTIMTTSAKQFIGPLTLETITCKAVPDESQGLTSSKKIAHLELVKDADVILIAPATANVIAKLAGGIADDLLSSSVISATCPVVIAPAMNSKMWLGEVNLENVRTLKGRGVSFVGPESGKLACEDEGIGRLAGISEIVGAVQEAARQSNELKGKRIIVTAGGTIEPIDKVRYISNFSSGKMGHACAKELARRGADVVLVVANADLAPFKNVKQIKVGTAREMLAILKTEFPRSNALVMAAAVADYRPAKAASSKIKRTTDKMFLELTPNPDILKEMNKIRKNQKIVAFAAETDDLLSNAKVKFKTKQADIVFANWVGRRDSDFGLDTTEAVMLVAGKGSSKTAGKKPVRTTPTEIKLGKLSKSAAARQLINELVKLFNG